MIARIDTPKGAATLTLAGRWVSADRRFQDYLNLAFPAELYPPSPSEPRQRWGQVIAAARELKGKPVWFEQGKPEPEGAVH